MVQVAVEKIHDIFNQQTKHQWEMRQTSASERVEMLQRLKTNILARLEDLIAASIKDYKTPRMTAEHQVYAAIEAIDYACEHVAQWMEPERVEQPKDGKGAYIVYESRGTVCIFGTWNSPMSVTIHPLTEALAAGNCVVIKPSEFNPHYNAVLQQIIEATFDERQVAFVQGEAETSEQLLKLPFSHFFFTGSPRVGKIVMREAANHLSAVTLELGGKSPSIIDKGYDVAKAAQALAFGKVLMGGQFCICPDYLFVHEQDVEAFAAAYRATTQGLLYENGEIRTTERTQIVNDAHFNRLKGLYDDAMSKGAVVLSGGTFDDVNRLIEPTLLGNVTEDMHIAHEEIFGPLTFLKAYTSLDEVLHYIQQRPKPLAFYVFSDDEAFQERCLRYTSSGGVTINGIVQHNTYLELPFGGVNNSGLGSFHGIHGFKTFSHARSVFEAY